MKKRILAAVMAVIFTMLQLSGMGPVSQVEAASSVDIDAHNLLEDPGFEDTTKEFVEHGTGSKVDKWSNYKPQVKKVNHDAHTGDWAVELSVSDCSIEQDSADLQIGTTYVAKVWAKVTNDYTTAYFGLKNHGAQEVKVKITSKEYAQYEIPFTYTGVSGDNLPRIYVWVESTSGGAAYADDFELLTDSELEEVSIENGKINVTFFEGYTGTPSKDDFSVEYTSSLDNDGTKELVITGQKVDGRKLELTFDPIEKEPLEQLITANITYVPKNQMITLDYTVEASGEALVEAEMVSLDVENGTATIVLDKVPTIAPAQGDFKVESKVNSGEFSEITITGFVYDSTNKTVTIKFPVINKKADKQEVTLKVTYNGKNLQDNFTVEIGNGTVYYVDATEGNDNNNGTSPETAFKTIDKVNSIIFQPGDQVLFQCGEEWTGALKPQGSGIEGAPIVIASYGEGDKPVLKPGDNWTIPYFQPGANDPVNNATVNNGISFYNQEYWEVRDLELYDPTYNPKVEPYVYRRGINITAKDCGDLHYFVFDNLTIHGYRGPSNNNGKSSGGIIVTVISDMHNTAKRVPSAIHDMTVTNCEMYDLGRSGFNFVSPWTTRTGSEWGAFGYRGYGEWKPNTNIYIANNTIYNIDGDGILIDGCKDVLVEHNVVYRTVLNCWYGVGMFNWNSDNTIFQFNEIYDTFPADSYKGAGDAQGIEIDALNRDTWVQYNYVHDNSGGCVMWCGTNDLRGFRGIYRYNIFQNDMTKHGVIDWRTNHKESMAYNNTFYFGELPEGASPRKFMNNGYMNGNSEAKFYNNIFYNLDEFDLNTFNEQEIDWERNIFYGFEEVPANDSTVITEDPLFVAPGTGKFGLDSVAGYKLQPESPAIDAGLNIENNGGRDYFGTPLTDGMTDIGAAEYAVELPPVEELDEVARLSGETRYETGYKVADALKEELGVNKFEAVIVATGKNFADALAGSYLAVVKNAPIILTNGKADNITTLHTYIKYNVETGGKVYILGGEEAVPAEVAALKGYDIVRLAGENRYETNLKILEEAGVTGDELIVATGKSFADSLSASATKLPILLINPRKGLDDEQIVIADKANKIYIIGGTLAVSADVEAELADYGDVLRVAGGNRYETSVEVANTFFPDAELTVAANAKNFPDGLCGGPLAASMNAPLILTADAKTEAAADYVAANEISSGYVLGGSAALADESVVEVLGVVPKTPEPYKIGVVTGTPEQSEEEYLAAQELKERYGDKIVLATFPDNFVEDKEGTIEVVTNLAADPEVKVIVFVQAIEGATDAINKVKETRDDILFVTGVCADAPEVISEAADICMVVDEIEMGTTTIDMAAKMGAKTFVHISFERHLNQTVIAARQQKFKDRCAELGIAYVEAAAPDPAEVGVDAAKEWVNDNVKVYVEQYGKDTAFFCTNCGMQAPLIQQVAKLGAIFPQQCCPSPYHGYPEAFGVTLDNYEWYKTYTSYMMGEIASKIIESGNSGRMATWTVSVNEMMMKSGVEYGIRWCEGKIADRCDEGALLDIMQDFAGDETSISKYYDETSGEIDNYFRILCPYKVF